MGVIGPSDGSILIVAPLLEEELLLEFKLDGFEEFPLLAETFLSR